MRRWVCWLPRRYRKASTLRTILHIITSLNSGGAERQLTALVRGSAHIDPHTRHVVVSLTNAGVYGAEIKAAGGHLYCLGLGRGQFSLAALWSLVVLLRQVRPSVLQSWLYHADLAAILAAPFADFPPLVWNLRCSDMDLSRYSRLTKTVLWLLCRLSRLPAVIVSNSAAGLSAHLAYGYQPRRTQIIPNGIDTAFFSRDENARASLRALWNVAEQERLIVCSARHDPMKDHAGLLKAFAGLRVPARLVLVGRGMTADNAALANEIDASGVAQDRLLLLGERRDIPQILSACDAFVMASAFGEGFPNAVAEAMACELPGIVTNVGDAAEIIGNPEWVVPPGQPLALQDAMEKLLKEYVPASGSEARKRICERYSMEQMIKAYMALYTDISLNRL